MSEQVTSPQDRIVAVMGPTGAGKSTFIERATRQDGRTVGHKLRSFTADIRAVRVTHPTDGRPVVFVDTPGFDDTSRSDVEILSSIAEFLVKTYKGNVNLATILYLHKISDNRMTGSVLKNLRMFASLCGKDAMPNVVITTTMWSKVDKEEGDQREEELRNDFWNDMVADGCRTARFENTHASAWRVVGSLTRKDQARVLLSSEIVDTHLRLNETTAGVTLNKELEKLIKDRKQASRRLGEQAKKHDNEQVVQQLNQQTAEIDEKIRETVGLLRQMKIPFTRRVRLFFKSKPS